MFLTDKSIFHDSEKSTGYEWLETNGLGGWSSSTVTGMHTRRYHGLVVAAINPPTGRIVLLSKLDETIVSGNERFELGVNQYAGNTIHPGGHRYLTSFHKNIFPEWIYEAGGVRLKKTIAMIHGENTVVIAYEVMKAAGAFKLELLPLMAARDYHSMGHESQQMHWDVDFKNGVFYNTGVYIHVPGSSYHHQPGWFYNFEYSEEKNRGLDHREDLLNHGIFSVVLQPGDKLGIIVSTDNTAGRNAYALLDWELMRRKKLIRGVDNEAMQQLLLAADQFIVKRMIKARNGEVLEGATIIAGYHWFTDWGRDTMISLPGLCISTGRYDDARKILTAFAASVSMGMLPNRFQDNDDDPEYNNVDGTLWYFLAVHEYLQATGDRAFILHEILPVLKDIIDWHFKGTRYNIKVADDGLLFAGEPGQQLTWMDARIGNWVVTPRMGKPVEIQALWYNSLKIFAELLQLNDQPADAALVNFSAEKAREAFNRQFWYAEGCYLYDVIDGQGHQDTSLRPNQIFALSLPYALIEGEKAESILRHVEEQLYTPVGLRSLSADNPNFVARYEGGPLQRDAAYHQGTAWSWLLGPYVNALMKVKHEKTAAKKVIENCLYHLAEAGVGSISEIFDAGRPHMPRGCIAQAWGVAELLRVIKKYELSK